MTTNGTARDPRFDLFTNMLLTRTLLWDRMRGGPTQDYDSACGYDSGPYTADVFQELYDDDPIAARVVEVLPAEAWAVTPTVYEAEDADAVTPFEAAWDGLSQSLRTTGAGASLYQDEAGALVWEYLRRADVLSGIGRYGLILLGLDDGKNLDQPATFAPGPAAARRLLYVRVFPEANATVSDYEKDLRNPRYGQPVRYTLSVTDPQGLAAATGLTRTTANVHWTRVLHVADNLAASEVFGVPRLQPVYRRVVDLRKLYGGSAEMYWRGAFPGLSLETHPQLGGDVQLDQEAMREMMSDYAAGLQRYLALQGMSANSLAPQVVDPTPQIERQLEAICIKLAIPKRIFMGSERGELASSQDQAAWNARLAARQQTYLTPRLIVPFVDRLIQLGILPQPAGYSVSWPELASQSPTEQATVAGQQTAALAQYVQSGAEQMVPPLDWLTRFLGLAEEEAAAILENAMQVEKEDVPPPDDEEEDEEDTDEEDEDDASPLRATPEGATEAVS